MVKSIPPVPLQICQLTSKVSAGKMGWSPGGIKENETMRRKTKTKKKNLKYKGKFGSILTNEKSYWEKKNHISIDLFFL